MTKQDVKSFNPRTNRFLAKLNQEDFEAFVREANIVPLKFRKRILLQDGPVDAVYFPLTCMFSLLVTTNQQPQMEMAMIGNEGVVGASEVFQSLGSMALCLIQIPGMAARISADAFRKLAGTRPLVQKLIHQHVYALMRQILFGAACNRIHSMEERCARWLLMTHDRAGKDSFPLTQEFLSTCSVSVEPP